MMEVCMNFSNLPEFYAKLDSLYPTTNNDLTNATYTNVDCNFVFSSKFARHRWFNYKEGFSPILVQKIFDEYNLTSESQVCDPFCGAGTTLAVAKANGMNSYGFEVNPFAAFITRVKTADYTEKDISSFQSYVNALQSLDTSMSIPLPDNEYLCRIFDSKMLQVQLCIRSYISSLAEGNAKSLFYFCWLCTLESCSLFRKAGNGLKKRSKPLNYENLSAFDFAYKKILEKAKAIVDDFSTDDNGNVPIVFEDSATTMSQHVAPNSLDLVLFSPPYANCFDYTKIYYLELWFGGFIESASMQKDIRMKSVRSHCHATWPERYKQFYLAELNDDILPLLSEQELWTDRIPDMLNGYFADMEEVLKNIYSSLKTGGHCDIVVSNSAYAGIIIPTDIFLAMIAEKIGFKVVRIDVERLIITSSQQYKKTEHLKKYLRESIVKLEK